MNVQFDISPGSDAFQSNFSLPFSAFVFCLVGPIRGNHRERAFSCIQQAITVICTNWQIIFNFSAQQGDTSNNANKLFLLLAEQSCINLTDQIQNNSGYGRPDQSDILHMQLDEQIQRTRYMKSLYTGRLNNFSCQRSSCPFVSPSHIEFVLLQNIDANPEILREPRGFLRIVQIVSSCHSSCSAYNLMFICMTVTFGHE